MMGLPISPAGHHAAAAHGRAGRAAPQNSADELAQLGVESFAAMFADATEIPAAKARKLPGQPADDKADPKAAAAVEIPPFMAWPGFTPPDAAKPAIPIPAGHGLAGAQAAAATAPEGARPAAGKREGREAETQLPPGFVPVSDATPIAVTPKPVTEEPGSTASRLETAQLQAADAKATDALAAMAPPPERIARPAAEFTIQVPVHAPGFAEQVVDKIAYIANHKIEEARLHVSPEALGPVEVRINIEEGRAAIAITAPSEAARTAMENSFDRLAERLSDHGLRLDSATVSDGRDGGAFHDERPAPRMRQEAVQPTATAEALPLAHSPRGLVDERA